MNKLRESIIGRPLKWGPMARARRVSIMLARELGGSGSGTQFNVSFESAKANAAAGKIAEILGGRYTTQRVKKEVAIIRIFEQLHDAGYELERKRYSLIEMAVTTRDVRNEYFEFDLETLQMSDLGLEKFSTLILEEPRAITNRKLFRQFVDIYRAGPKYLKRVENGANIDIVHTSVQAENRQYKPLSILSTTISKLQQISPADFERTSDEKRLIKQLSEIVKHLERIY